MTMLQLIMSWEFGSFLQKITLLYWSNLPTLQIWLLVTSFCFPNSRKSSTEAIKTAVTRELQAIPEESFHECVEAWQRRLEKCIRAQGNYFEVDML